MNFEQVLELVKAVSESNVTTLKYEEGDTKITIRAGEEHMPYEPVHMPAGVPQRHPHHGGCELQGMPPHEMPPHGMPPHEMPPRGMPPHEMPPHPHKGADRLDGRVMTSPLVGTFYVASSEEAEPFVKVGDKVETGQVLAIVEAMKLMNEIECECDGEVTEVLVGNGQSVEYGQPLFVIRY